MTSLATLFRLGVTAVALLAGAASGGAALAVEPPLVAGDGTPVPPHTHVWVKQTRKEWVPPVKETVQVGVDAKGKLQVGIEKQVEQVWKNIREVLKSAGMTFADVAKVNVFLTDSRFIPPYREVRDRFFPKAPFPASTLLIVAGLADPGMLVEVEVVAVK